ncbi:MAG: TIGR00730 family Rossman fold protein [Clostridia bacterium]|nr:TIGR00730 family Rossman fold protein [Clostridia bacterium]
MRKTITVFCGSSDGNVPAYGQAAEELGRLMALEGRRLVYGSGQCGMMGRVAKGVKDAGGYIIGINVKRFAEYLPYPGTDEFLMMDTLPERKDALIQYGEACVALPGGVGTLDELMEIYALAQAGILKKPLGILNVNHYFDGLLTQLDQACRDGFLTPADRALLITAQDPETLLRLLDEA